MLTPLAGCSSSGVKVDGGVNLLGSRRLKVGEEFTVSQKIEGQTGPEWRLSEYDSAFVAPSGQPRLEQGSDGSYIRIVPFIAKSPGSTELVFLRRNTAPIKYGEPLPTPDSKVLRIKIVP